MAALAIQLDLFEEQTEELFMQKELDALIKGLHNVRRGLYAEVSELKKISRKQQEEIDVLKRQFALVMRNK